MQHKDDLTFETPDSLGKIPDLSLIGQVFEHSGNNKLYRLSGYSWEGESDRWMFEMYPTQRTRAVTIVRPLEHLRGKRSDGIYRYFRAAL